MSYKNITLIITGASGAQYALRLLEQLVIAQKNITLLISRPGQIVINSETEISIPSRASEIQSYFTDLYKAKPDQIKVYEKEQWMAPVASGSGVGDATIVCPCTMGTLSSIAVGSSKSLLERAADVAIKERKKLILVVRETPFSDTHLENMLKLSRMDVVIMPANPGFYHQPKTLDDIVDFMVARILDHLQISHELVPKWGS